MVKDIKSEKEFEEIIKNSKNTIVIDFWATWCMPCQIMGQILDEISGEFKKIDFAKINIDELRPLAGRFEIMSIPTLLIFKKAKIVSIISESKTEDELREILKKFNK